MNVRLLLLLLLLGTARTGLGQAKQLALLDRLPLLPLPLHIDYTLRVKSVPVSRQEVWKQLILPLNGFVPDSTEWMGFPIDSSSILDYQQWKGLNKNRRELAIPYYSPIFSGKLFVIGKVALAGGTTGVLWGFHERDALYGAGPVYWLIVPGARPGKSEYRRVYERQTGGPMEAGSFRLWAELRPDQLTLYRRDVWLNTKLDGKKPSSKPEVIRRQQRFTITSHGLVEQK
jgi:hypothetical protein